MSKKNKVSKTILLTTNIESDKKILEVHHYKYSSIRQTLKFTDRSIIKNISISFSWGI